MAARFRAMYHARSPYDTVVTLHAQPTDRRLGCGAYSMRFTTVFKDCEIYSNWRYARSFSNKTHGGKQEMPAAATAAAAAAAVDGLCISSEHADMS